MNHTRLVEYWNQALKWTLERTCWWRRLAYGSDVPILELFCTVSWQSQTRTIIQEILVHETSFCEMKEQNKVAVHACDLLKR